MNIQEALNVLRPTGDTAEDLKEAYRQACKKYHPDINPNGLELMKLINCAYEFLKKNANMWTHKQQTNDQGIDEILQGIFDKIKHFVNIEAEVCGSWLWLDGETWRYKKQLKEYGFRWAPNKMKWYWRPEGYKKKSRRTLSMGEIRALYGSIELDQDINGAIAA